MSMSNSQQDLRLRVVRAAEAALARQPYVSAIETLVLPAGAIARRYPFRYHPIHMSGMIDDTRKLFQDLIAPEFKALQEQVKALETSTGTGFTSVEKSMHARFSALETVISANKDVVLAQIRSLEGKVDSNHASVLNTLNIEKRLEQLERLQQAASKPAEPGRTAYAPAETKSGKTR
jgi:uncharacterized protein YqgV (UPF0045/DUF77 family)